MLEKKLGIIKISKLSTIMFLDVDFNVVNKIIFNTKLMPNYEKNQYILIEIQGDRRGQLLIQVALCKKLISNAAN